MHDGSEHLEKKASQHAKYGFVALIREKIYLLVSVKLIWTRCLVGQNHVKSEHGLITQAAAIDFVHWDLRVIYRTVTMACLVILHSILSST